MCAFPCGLVTNYKVTIQHLETQNFLLKHRKINSRAFGGGKNMSMPELNLNFVSFDRFILRLNGSEFTNEKKMKILLQKFIESLKCLSCF